MISKIDVLSRKKGICRGRSPCLPSVRKTIIQFRGHHRGLPLRFTLSHQRCRGKAVPCPRQSIGLLLHGQPGRSTYGFIILQGQVRYLFMILFKKKACCCNIRNEIHRTGFCRTYPEDVNPGSRYRWFIARDCD